MPRKVKMHIQWRLLLFPRVQVSKFIDSSFIRVFMEPFNAFSLKQGFGMGELFEYDASIICFEKNFIQLNKTEIFFAIFLLCIKKRKKKKEKKLGASKE